MARIDEPYEAMPSSPRASETGHATPVLGPCFFLEVTAGSNAGVNVAIDDGSAPMFAGTSATCELRVADAAVARRHLRFEVSNGRLRLCELGSASGTFVNDVRAAEALLEGGETIRIGETSIAVRHAICELASRGPAASFGAFVGTSVTIRRLYPACAKLAASRAPLIIEGEPGTGKESLAKAIHHAGERAFGPFVVVDCTALPPTQLALALFGRDSRGTEETAAVEGAFEQARGGTLFIDEVGELDLGLQARLLQGLQRSEIRRIGSNAWRTVDVRIIVSTRRDLDTEVSESRFLDGLFTVLAGARLSLPPLRERSEDIELLARHFWAIHTRWRAQPFPENLLGRWKAYGWPGNVRELSSTLARLATFGEISAKEAREVFARRSTPPEAHDTLDELIAASESFADARARIIAEFERRYIGFLDAHHVGERARVSASGLSDRYLRVLRGRARDAVRRSPVC
ncbi:sigma-54-dependent Fis family transcriptional regulator [Labilithrix luteola]|nr:sigma 54-interacting transcriptional regulator [Labilithrix luteola]